MSLKRQSDIFAVRSRFPHAELGTRPGPIEPDDGSTAAQVTAQIHIVALFQNIRRVLDCSRADAGMRLKTSPQVIKDLETGRFENLPPWAETSRIVSAYTQLVGIDPSPALHVLKGVKRAPQSLLDSARETPNGRYKPSVRWRRGHSGTPIPAGETHTYSSTDGEPHGPTAFSSAVAARMAQMTTALTGAINRKTGFAAPTRSSGSPSKGLTATTIGIGIASIAAIAALTSPAVARFASNNLPAPLAHVVLSAHSLLSFKSGLSTTREYERDGMRWIESSDPRSRRTNKLTVPPEQ